MTGTESILSCEDEGKKESMQEQENLGWDMGEEDALGLWLREAVREGAYTEEYCTKLEAYDKVTKNRAAVFYFTARLAFALGEMEEAHRLAHEAYRRRKISHKIWQILFEIGDALGLDEEAIFFKALCQKNMELDVPLPIFQEARWQDAFFCGMLDVQLAPFRFDFVERADGSRNLDLVSAHGQFLMRRSAAATTAESTMRRISSMYGQGAWIS